MDSWLRQAWLEFGAELKRQQRSGVISACASLDEEFGTASELYDLLSQATDSVFPTRLPSQAVES